MDDIEKKKKKKEKEMKEEKIDGRSAVKAKRIQYLASLATEQLKKGAEEEAVRKELRRVALLKWAPCRPTLTLYVEGALARAKAAREGGGEEKW